MLADRVGLALELGDTRIVRLEERGHARVLAVGHRELHLELVEGRVLRELGQRLDALLFDRPEIGLGREPLGLRLRELLVEIVELLDDDVLLLLVGDEDALLPAVLVERRLGRLEPLLQLAEPRLQELQPRLVVGGARLQALAHEGVDVGVRHPRGERGIGRRIGHADEARAGHGFDVDAAEIGVDEPGIEPAPVGRRAGRAAAEQRLLAKRVVADHLLRERPALQHRVLRAQVARLVLDRLARHPLDVDDLGIARRNQQHGLGAIEARCPERAHAAHDDGGDDEPRDEPRAPPDDADVMHGIEAGGLVVAQDGHRLERRLRLHDRTAHQITESPAPTWKTAVKK